MEFPQLTLTSDPPLPARCTLAQPPSHNNSKRQLLSSLHPLRAESSWKHRQQDVPTERSACTASFQLTNTSMALAAASPVLLSRRPEPPAAPQLGSRPSSASPCGARISCRLPQRESAREPQLAMATKRAPLPARKAVADPEAPTAPPGPVEDAELKAGIARFYDASSGLWEDMWGEHMHHGYYVPAGAASASPPADSAALPGDGAPPTAESAAPVEGLRGHQLAQIEMIERSLAWAGVAGDGQGPRRILDVGCGIGGSARYLARKYAGAGASVTGITLSPRQAQRGNEICAERGLEGQVKLMVADAMNPPFPDASFDLLWSMESGEHMPDKPKFVGELARLAAPGGRLLIVTWCHRNLDKARGETELTASEKALLASICDCYYLPAWCSGDDYVEIAQGLGLKNVRSADWTEYVTPFWPAVIATALTFKGFVGLLKAGWETMRGAIAMFYMVQGFSRGLIKFVIITAEK